MLAAVARSHIGHNHAHSLFRNVERLRQFRAHTEGALRASPDGELVVLPFGDRRARLKRSMRDVGDVISLFEFVMRRRKALRHRAATAARLRSVRILFQILEEFRARRLWRGFPFGFDGGESLSSQMLARRSHANEIAITN